MGGPATDVATRLAGARAPKPSYPELPSRSPWIAQLEPYGPARPLAADLTTDVAIVGAGIAGVATAFFALRATACHVALIERDRVAGGATGRNAGQLTTYFERPLGSIAEEFGADLAVEGQRDLDEAHDLLDLMADETGASVRIERFTGHMGMFSLNHVLVHLRNNQVRAAGGLRREACVVSEDAPFLRDIPAEYAELYDVVPQTTVRELLETDDDRYRAVLSDRKGCANSGLLVQQVLAALERRYPDRFVYADRTPVTRILLGPGTASLQAGGRTVKASRVVLCTNGFVDHVVEDAAGRPVQLHPDQRVVGTIGYMAAFFEPTPRTPAAFSYIRNVEIGGDVPYVYVTRRTYDLPNGGGSPTLTCMGGPEWPVADGSWRADLPYPGELLATMDRQVRPFAQPARAPGLPYDFQWHGLMGYMPGRIRVIGAHPRHSELLYNLGCNGVGFLPSIHGAREIARILAGEPRARSIFDPREL
ncbi:MAG TPA: FAD-binding oxidoreductase [Candidatus Binatus sp.]|nr:FAD-binding oxidoreductase [Candidatus Binatus sp.]